MNAQQKRFYNEVIKPQIVAMAIDGSLPMDMNELHWDLFESAADAFNHSAEEKRRIVINELGMYINTQDHDASHQLTQLELAYTDFGGDTQMYEVADVDPVNGFGDITIEHLFENLLSTYE